MNSNFSSQRQSLVLSLALSIVFVSPVTQKSVQAAVYKCVGDDGSTTYNDTPCAANETIHRLSKTARKIDSLDCRIARNFAVDAAARMRQDDTTEDMFDAYGGAQQISVGAHELINYVFSFNADKKLSSKRIVDLTIERCEAGLLGNAMDECQSYPKDFISRSGGCIAARKSDRTIFIRANENAAKLKKALDGDQSEPTLNAANPEESPIEILDQDGAALSTDDLPITSQTEGPVLLPEVAPAALDIESDEAQGTEDLE